MRVIQVGLGVWGWGWAETQHGAEKAEMAAVADLSEAARERARREFGLGDGQIFSTLEEAMAGVEADAVLVATPASSHPTLISSGARGGPPRARREAADARKHPKLENPDRVGTLEAFRKASRTTDWIWGSCERSGSVPCAGRSATKRQHRPSTSSSRSRRWPTWPRCTRCSSVILGREQAADDDSPYQLLDLHKLVDK